MTILKKHRIVCQLVSVLCLLAVTDMALGWGGIAHYLITKDAAQQLGNQYQGTANDKVENYSYLPDYVASNDISWLIIIIVETAEYFRWGHAVIDQGTYNVYLVVALPKKPTYPDDGRYPGLIMAELLRKSDLSSASDAKKWELVNTVNGFRSHNAADRVVHFEFFDGAEDNMTDQEQKDGWTIHHGLKETYADYVLLRKQYTNNTISWNADGSIDPPTGMSIVLKGNAKLMHLAQEVFRKSRRIHKYDGADSFTVQTVEAISSAITKKNDGGDIDEFNNMAGTYFSTKCWARWLAAADTVHLVRKVHKWDATQKAFVELADKDCRNEPANLHAEYDQLMTIRESLIDEKNPEYHGDPTWMGKFDLWDYSAIKGKYDNSVTKAKAWMISKSAIFGN